MNKVSGAQRLVLIHRQTLSRTVLLAVEHGAYLGTVHQQQRKYSFLQISGGTIESKTPLHETSKLNQIKVDSSIAHLPSYSTQSHEEIDGAKK